MLYVSILCFDDGSISHITQSNFETQQAYFEGAVTALEKVYKTKAKFVTPTECSIGNCTVTQSMDL